MGRLSRLESIPFERRSFLQKAMLETIEGRLLSLSAAERGSEGFVEEPLSELSHFAEPKRLQRSSRSLVDDFLASLQKRRSRAPPSDASASQWSRRSSACSASPSEDPVVEVAADPRASEARSSSGNVNDGRDDDEN